MALIRRQLYVCPCLLVLLLAVAFPASTVDATGECYWTAMHVPRWCRAEFIKALWNNDREGIREKCCIRLACANDPPCFHVLEDFCDIPFWTRYCSTLPPLRTSKPLPPPPGHHH
jgi:hypothetical protein